MMHLPLTMRRLRPATSALSCAALLLLAACGDDGPAGPKAPDNGTGRGSIVSSELVLRYSVSDAAGLIAQTGMAGAFQARRAVEMYRVVYRTLGADGSEVQATAGVYLPVSSSAVPLVSYSHGTITLKQDVPSNALNIEGLFNGVLQASHGSVFVAADLLGLGANSGFHPYLHAQMAASASLDALRAARRLAGQKQVALNGKLFLYGYSQGGHTAMALHREIEQSAGNEFTVTASAPMSGPYDLYGSSRAVLQEAAPNPSQSVYAVYILSAYRPLYDLAGSLDQLIRPPYDTHATTLQTSGIAFQQLVDRLAPVPSDNVQPAVLQAVLDDPEHPISLALRANDVYDWRPLAPVRLYFGTADRDVPPQNAATAAAAMTALGAQVTAIDLGPLDHAGAVLPAYHAARIWFDTF